MIHISGSQVGYNKILMFLFNICVLSVQAASDLQTIRGLGLPVVDVSTENGEMPTCDIVEHPEGCMGQGITNINKVHGRLRIFQGDAILFDSGDYQKDSTGIMIRVRGNSSAWQDKKPYKIKLQKKADLLMRGDDEKYGDKEWLLIKDERVTLNTVIGLKVNELMQMQWTPAYCIVNLVLNGDYRGVYLLIESVKRNNRCRLDVDKQTGYVFEYDPYWWNEDVYLETRFTESLDAKFTFKVPNPNHITEEQLKSLKNTLDNFENSLTSSGYQRYIDIESFASWLLAQDVLGNYDGHGSNVFMTKYDDTPQSRIRMANLWDFDAIMLTPDAWSNSHRILYFGTLLDHPDMLFEKAYKQKWNAVKKTLFHDLESFLDSFADSDTGRAFDRSIPYDSERWGRTGKTLDELKAEADAWFSRREQWLDGVINDYSAIDDTGSVNKQTSIYDIQGRRLKSPTKGVSIIRQSDGTTKKVIVK